MHDAPITLAGQPLATAAKALILLHGRGSSAADILSLARYLPVADYALLAPRPPATAGIRSRFWLR
jgi:phospholipase/carboxylesterase